MELVLFPQFLFLAIFLFRCSVEVFCILVSALLLLLFFLMSLSACDLAIWEDKGAITEIHFWKRGVTGKKRPQAGGETILRANTSYYEELRSVKQPTKKGVKGH